MKNCHLDFSNLSTLPSNYYFAALKLSESTYSTPTEPLEIAADLTSKFPSLTAHILDTTTGEILFEVKNGDVTYAAF